MERPLEIAFHSLPPSDALDAEIRKRVAKLEKFFPRLIGCRVSVEALHNQHQTGNLYEVHIVLSVPGRDIAVTREPHKAKQRYAHPDAYVSVREAFEAAERQLGQFKERRRDAPVSPDGAALTGQVALIQPGDDHGFILNNTGTQLYFHRDSVTDAHFEDLKEGDIVHYVEEESDSGPVAVKVRLGTRHGET